MVQKHRGVGGAHARLESRMSATVANKLSLRKITGRVKQDYRNRPARSPARESQLCRL